MDSGQLVIDANVTGRRVSQNLLDMADTFVVYLDDVRDVLNSCLRFIGDLYDELDPFKRHQRFLFNVALINIGYRSLEEGDVKRSSYTVNIQSENQPIIAYSEPRVVNRLDLQQPEEENERVIAMFKRQVG